MNKNGEQIGHASENEKFFFDYLVCYILTSLGTPYGILVWKIIINCLKQTYNQTSKLLS